MGIPFTFVDEDLRRLCYGKAGSLVGNRLTFADSNLQWSDLDRFNLLLVGISNGSNADALHNTRKAYYQLHLHSNQLNMIDVGDINVPSTAWSEMLSKLLDTSIAVLILDPSSLITENIFKLNAAKAEDFSATRIAENIPDNEVDFFRKSNKNSLARYSILGYQSYLTNPLAMRLTSKHSYEGIRLGELRSNIASTEPILRDTHLLMVSMGAVRLSDGGSMQNSNPNGLYAEEICQLAWYAGISDSLSQAVIQGFGENDAASAATYQLVAQIVWHITDGYATRKNELPTGEHIKRFFVDMGGQGNELQFYQSKLTNRWWMGIPILSADGRQVLVACTHSDYMKACSKEIPNRWLFYYQKFNSTI